MAEPVPVPAVPAKPGFFGKVVDILSGRNLPGWVGPAAAIGISAPIIGYALDRYNRKKAWETEMRKRYLIAQARALGNPLFNYPVPPQALHKMGELRIKAAMAIESTQEDPVDVLGKQINKSKKVKHRTAGYLHDHEEPYTGDENNHTSRLELGGSPGGAGPNAMSGGG